MKAISLWQPWASLIMLGEKRMETRHWCPPRNLVGERIAIHAAKRVERCVLDRPFSDVIPDPVRGCPTGALLGTVILRSAWRMGDHLSIEELLERNGAEHEQRFGDWRTGRFAWVLSDVVRLEEPLPCKGRQSFFDVPTYDLRVIEESLR